MKTVVVILALCGVALAKYVAFPQVATTDDFYELCAKNGTKCVGAWSKSEAENGACITDRNCTKAYATEVVDGVHVFHLFGSNVAYMAIGFSADQGMGSDAVVACVVDGTEVKGILSHNEGYSNKKSASNDGLVIKESKLVDGTIFCSFTLNDTVSYARTLETDNTDTEFYVVGAGGDLNADGSLGHHKGHLFSAEKWSFPTVSSASALASSLLVAVLAVFISLRS